MRKHPEERAQGRAPKQKAVRTDIGSVTKNGEEFTYYEKEFDEMKRVGIAAWKPRVLEKVRKQKAEGDADRDAIGQNIIYRPRTSKERNRNRP